MLTMVDYFSFFPNIIIEINYYCDYFVRNYFGYLLMNMFYMSLFLDFVNILGCVLRIASIESNSCHANNFQSTLL